MTITKENLGDGTYPENFAEYQQSGTVHTIEFEVRDSSGARAVPATGTVTIKYRTPGGFGYLSPSPADVDLTNEANWGQTINGVHIGAMELTLASLEAGHTLSYTISSSFGGA